MSRLNHYINDKITLPYMASIIGLDRIDETYIENHLNFYAFESNSDNYHLLMKQTNSSNMIFPSLNDLKENHIKIMLAPVVIDADTKEAVVARSLSFEKFEDINFNQITHFYSIEKRKYENNYEYIFRGIMK